MLCLCVLPGAAAAPALGGAAGLQAQLQLQQAQAAQLQQLQQAAQLVQLQALGNGGNGTAGAGVNVEAPAVAAATTGATTAQSDVS